MSIVSGSMNAVMSSNATEDAANLQAQASAAATAEQRAAREQARQYMDPYYQQGLAYQNQLASKLPGLMTPYTMDMYKQSPEYQNQLLATQQAQDAIMAQRAATGQAGGGGALLALQNAAQQQAQLGYQTGLADYWSQNLNQYNMLAPLAASGQNAAVLQGGIATNAANALANTMQQGAAQQGQYKSLAGQQLGQGIANIGQQALGAYGAYNQYQLMQQYLNSGTGTTSLASIPAMELSTPSIAEGLDTAYLAL